MQILIMNLFVFIHLQTTKLVIARFLGEGTGLDSNAVPGDLKQETVTVDGKIVPTIEEKKTDSWVHWEDFKKAFKWGLITSREKFFAVKLENCLKYFS